MPSNYKRISNQQSWNAVSMKKAIDVVKNKNISYNKAAKCFNVPRTTLKRRVEDVNVDATDMYYYYYIIYLISKIYNIIEVYYYICSGNKKILGRFH